MLARYFLCQAPRCEHSQPTKQLCLLSAEGHTGGGAAFTVCSRQHLDAFDTFDEPQSTAHCRIPCTCNFSGQLVAIGDSETIQREEHLRIKVSRNCICFGIVQEEEIAIGSPLSCTSKARLCTRWFQCRISNCRKTRGQSDQGDS